jgi:glucose-1-phosphate thymidylyltransferase
MLQPMMTKGVILAGGKGTRLSPLTKVTNKHLLPVYDRQMICYPIESLIAAGIRDILIVTGRGHAGHFVELLESGQAYGARFSYAVQEEAGGIAHALQLAEHFVGNEKFIVLLGDNIFEHDLRPALDRFVRGDAGAMIFLKEVVDPRPYGVAVLANGKLTTIVEKPKDPPSNLAVVGMYCYAPEVFGIARALKPSARGELEITDVNNAFLQQGRLAHEVLDGWWGDAGESFESLLHATQHMAAKRLPVTTPAHVRIAQ